MSTDPIVLYTYWRSSCSYRVRFALAAKGIVHESIPVNILKGEHRSTEHHARNPMGYVPCLVVDGRPLIESVAILEFLEERFPSPALLPKDPFDRANVRALVELVNAGTQPLQNMSVLERVSVDKLVRDDWARHFIERGIAAIEGLLARFEDAGIPGPYAYGSALTLADCALVPQVYNARRFGIDMDRYPRVTARANAAGQTDAAQRAAPESQPDAVTPG